MNKNFEWKKSKIRNAPVNFLKNFVKILIPHCTINSGYRSISISIFFRKIVHTCIPYVEFLRVQSKDILQIFAYTNVQT